MLALTLLCLALPFTAVSCESSLGDVEVEYTGWELAFGGEPSIEVSGKPDTSPDESAALPPQPLMIITLAVLVLGLALLANPRAHAAVGVVTGAVAFLFLVATQVAVHSALGDELIESNDVEPSDVPDMIETRSGFWLALLLVALVAAYSARVLVASRRTAVAPTPPPAP
ncbi:hypothetical protein DFJ66_7815 [Saccharothrix variisporea]|uniref:Uncharacterized protein n=2 Tax=Saccharothrix variisporea TaxID=543527 RepID=A0A495XNI4_9PSEU|nr:hypothetical protein DFJ66_7815 [Saccharothrix variisporea]